MFWESLKLGDLCPSALHILSSPLWSSTVCLCFHVSATSPSFLPVISLFFPPSLWHTVKRCLAAMLLVVLTQRCFTRQGFYFLARVVTCSSAESDIALKLTVFQLRVRIDTSVCCCWQTSPTYVPYVEQYMRWWCLKCRRGAILLVWLLKKCLQDGPKIKQTKKDFVHHFDFKILPLLSLSGDKVQPGVVQPAISLSFIHYRDEWLARCTLVFVTAVVNLLSQRTLTLWWLGWFWALPWSEVQVEKNPGSKLEMWTSVVPAVVFL